ncbi:MAG: hypothetical protein KVP17_000432 [Porospora cf. gigantea B]|uniref:uncharacterized protein n=1 Tax=Porospora cf. gigantea B TaxID=2853592 RepID=UPI003571D7BB|nr:MAG: hypothetical protein KVP17_000432 [Porospora cf. gigantea B]
MKSPVVCFSSVAIASVVNDCKALLIPPASPWDLAACQGYCHTFSAPAMQSWCSNQTSGAAVARCVVRYAPFCAMVDRGTGVETPTVPHVTSLTRTAAEVERAAGCRMGSGASFVGYSAPRNPERDGIWTMVGEKITVYEAPSAPLGCSNDVLLPRGGVTYSWKEFFSLIGNAKLECAGWDQEKHDHAKRNSVANGNCSGAPYFTFDNLALAAGMFPDFLASSSTAANSLELAAFMANSSKETTGGWASEGYSGWAWCHGFEIGHPGSMYGNQYDLTSSERCASWGDQQATLTAYFPRGSMNIGYYGRGAFHLTRCYNYGCFRNFTETYLGLPRTPKRDFLANPGFVATEWPFASALWLWMSPEEAGNKPSLHSITSMWEPNGVLSVDNAGRSNDFGYLINVINGEIECGSSAHDGPKIRVDYMTKYMDQLGVDTSQYRKQLQTAGGCVGQASLNSQPFLHWKHPDGSHDGGNTGSRCT